MTEAKKLMSIEKIPCPFVYANGKKCTEHVARIEAYKADIMWPPNEDGTWKCSIGEPRSHYHVFCSEKNNHAGYGREDALKFYYSDLPKELQAALLSAL
jgi:hypothetical protein